MTSNSAPLLEHFEVARTSHIASHFLAAVPEHLAVACASELDIPTFPRLWTDHDRIQILQRVLTEHEDIRGQVGLEYAKPPEEVHAVSNQPFGDFTASNLVVEVLAENEIALATGERVLDFGCSSGRVIRTLAAYFPEVQWVGCDPRSDSITWTQENFPTIDWFVSQSVPPLPGIADASIHGTYAISVWSHFSEERALEWLAEMARVTTSGGFLLITGHGLRSLHHYSRVRKTLDVDRAAAIADALAGDHGYAFHPYPHVGEESELEAGHWGMAYINPEWWRRVPGWTVQDVRVGRLMNNQDVYLLRRT